MGGQQGRSRRKERRRGHTAAGPRRARLSVVRPRPPGLQYLCACLGHPAMMEATGRYLGSVWQTRAEWSGASKCRTNSAPGLDNADGDVITKRCHSQCGWLGAWRSLASAPEWGSGGRWFESSRPDIASLAVTTSCSEAFPIRWRPLCRILCRKLATFGPVLSLPGIKSLLLAELIRRRFLHDGSH